MVASCRGAYASFALSVSAALGGVVRRMAKWKMAQLFHYAKGNGPQTDIEGYNCCLTRLIAVIWIVITLLTMLV